jgi:hypothetical protein
MALEEVLRFLAIPWGCVPRSKTPVVKVRLALTPDPMLPSSVLKLSAHTISRFSRLIRAAHTLAVYASLTGFPRVRARLASDLLVALWSGRTSTCWDG